MKPLSDWPDYPDVVQAARLAWDLAPSSRDKDPQGNLVLGIYSTSPTWKTRLARELCRLWDFDPPRIIARRSIHPETKRPLEVSYRTVTFGPTKHHTTLVRLFARLQRDIKRWATDHPGTMDLRPSFAAGLAACWDDIRRETFGKGPGRETRSTGAPGAS